MEIRDLKFTLMTVSAEIANFMPVQPGIFSSRSRAKIFQIRPGQSQIVACKTFISPETYVKRLARAQTGLLDFGYHENFRISPENTEEGLSLRARTAYWALPLLHFPKKYQPAKDFPAPTNLGLSW
jgi:hypothetical protein